MEHKQHESGGRIIYSTGITFMPTLLQRVFKMAETKLAAIILNLLGIPLCFIAFIRNIDNVKSSIIFLLALTFLLVRLYFFVVWAKQKTRKNELELRRMEKDLTK